MEQDLSTLNNWPAYHNLDDEQDAKITSLSVTVSPAQVLT